MKQTAIFWPMLAHVLLVFIVYVVLAIRRGGAVKTGEANVRQFKGRTDEPASSVTAANNVMNQFELPVLFHVACISLFVTQGVTTVTLTLAWLFAALRYPHAWVHLTTNKLRWRNMLFRGGVVTLLGLWVAFAGTVRNPVSGAIERAQKECDYGDQERRFGSVASWA